MPKGFDPILPKKKDMIGASEKVRKATAALGGFIVDFADRARNYEVPATATYVRTHHLSGSWSHQAPRRKGNDIVGEVRSSARVAPYNIYVRGPKEGPVGKKQAERMARRGWLSITEIADKLWPKARARIQAAFRG
jgi:hypothetical protein